MIGYPGRRPQPTAIAEGWRVEIPMPVDRSGKPFGWLSANDHQTHWGKKARIARAWRTAAYKAYEARRLPQGLNHVHVEIQLRFPDRIPRDPANYEPTIKPIIDALQPTTHKVVDGKLVVSLGWGVIPGDDPRFLTRGAELPVGEPLGRRNPVRGIVTVIITPFNPSTV